MFLLCLIYNFNSVLTKSAYNLTSLESISSSNLNFFFYRKNLNFFLSSFFLINNQIEANSVYESLNQNKLINLKEQKNFKYFQYLKKSSFIYFFIENLIDVPTAFKNIKSLRTKSFELPALRFLNMLMKHGKKEKIFKIFWKSFFSFFFIFKDKITSHTVNEIKFYSILNNVFFNFLIFNLIL